jgi:hypothetical protein
MELHLPVLSNLVSDPVWAAVQRPNMCSCGFKVSRCFGGPHEKDGKKKNQKSPDQATECQYRRKPWQLGGDWEVYPAEVPPYHPWAPGQSNTQLHCALDGLRQGELWICMQLKLFAEAVEEDMRARAELLEDHAHKIHTLEGLLRSAGQTIELLVSRDGQLIDMRDSFVRL